MYSHVDRMVTFGIMPVNKDLSIDDGIDVWSTFGTHYILERREIGIFNLGGDSSITVDGTKYELGFEDCLYIPKSLAIDYIILMFNVFPYSRLIQTETFI